ncbi:hypothetical protein DOY81_009896 [Sarcophaga bullata]|nr:hypothetical protein DOY81_009896 [Sarcophaga bullata]
MPSKWNKIGEVYGNVIGQSIFVCCICIENAKSMDNVYNTSDASAFCWHIKQHYTSESDAIEKQKPAKTLPTATTQCDSNYYEEHEAQYLETLHQNLVEKLAGTHETTNKKSEGNYQTSSNYPVSDKHVGNNATIEISDNEEDPNIIEIPTKL